MYCVNSHLRAVLCSATQVLVYEKKNDLINEINRVNFHCSLAGFGPQLPHTRTCPMRIEDRLWVHTTIYLLKRQLLTESIHSALGSESLSKSDSRMMVSTARAVINYIHFHLWMFFSFAIHLFHVFFSLFLLFVDCCGIYLASTAIGVLRSNVAFMIFLGAIGKILCCVERE